MRVPFTIFIFTAPEKDFPADVSVKELRPSNVNVPVPPPKFPALRFVKSRLP